MYEFGLSYLTAYPISVGSARISIVPRSRIMQVCIKLAVWCFISRMPQGNENFRVVLLNKVNGTINVLKLDKGTSGA